jgi:hypothetical protein
MSTVKFKKNTVRLKETWLETKSHYRLLVIRKKLEYKCNELNRAYTIVSKENLKCKLEIYKLYWHYFIKYRQLNIYLKDLESKGITHKKK